MENAAPIAPPWIAEDDLLLKNAVEAGASLEALAKGAVQFSRRYTLQELQERWHTLLYDPDVSETASARMMELELSCFSPVVKFNRIENIKGNKELPLKRKIKSIRKHYYVMRKKIRNDFFNSTDLDFLDGTSLPDFNGHGADFQQHAGHGSVSQDGNALGNCIPDNLGFQEAEIDILRNAFPEALGDIAPTSSVAYQTGCTNTIDDNQVNDVYRKNGFPEGFPDSLQERDTCVQPNVPKDSPVNYENCSVSEACCLPSAASDGDFIDLPDSLLNLSNDDDIISVEEDARNTANSSDKNAIIVNASDHILEGGVCTHESETFVDSESYPLPLSGAMPIDSEVVASSICALEVSSSEINVPSNIASNPDSNKLNDGSICCTLNTEDTEIPCNDDIFLLIHPSTSFGPAVTEPRSTHYRDPSSAVNQKDTKPGVNSLIRGKDSAQSLAWSHKIEPNILGETRVQHRAFSSTVKSKIPDTNRLTLLHGDANKALAHSSQGRSLQGIPEVPVDREQEPSATRTGVVGNPPDTFHETPRFSESVSAQVAVEESSVNPSASDQEEPASDDDVPYFSDIEAMILDMDLDPPDQDSYATKQVIKYHPEDSKRTIVRLEQCAHSCTHRAMTSHGAFGIIYGRHLRHFIKKTEVILGRSTDDTEVDIDLRKEGNANKISRRQAIIRMEQDGSFSLRNIGKSSVTVNGKSVDTGKMQFLSSSCLIEIRGMAFVFEINKKYVQRYLSSVAQKDKGKLGKFDWSPEG